MKPNFAILLNYYYLFKKVFNQKQDLINLIFLRFKNLTVRDVIIIIIYFIAKGLFVFFLLFYCCYNFLSNHLCFNFGFFFIVR